MRLETNVTCNLWPWDWFNIKMSSHPYSKSHRENKKILLPSYLHNDISFAGIMTSLYWIRAQTVFLKFSCCYKIILRFKCWFFPWKYLLVVVHISVSLTTVRALWNNGFIIAVIVIYIFVIVPSDSCERGWHHKLNQNEIYHPGILQRCTTKQRVCFTGNTVPFAMATSPSGWKSVP